MHNMENIVLFVNELNGYFLYLYVMCMNEYKYFTNYNQVEIYTCWNIYKLKYIQVEIYSSWNLYKLKYEHVEI